MFQPEDSYVFTWTGVECLGYAIRIDYMETANTTGTYSKEMTQTTEPSHTFVPPESLDEIRVDIWAYNSEPFTSTRAPDYSGESFYCYYDLTAFGFSGMIAVQ